MHQTPRGNSSHDFRLHLAMKQLDQQQRPLTLCLRAKANNLNLNLKLKLSRIFFPHCKPTRFSIQFNLLNYVLEIRSKPKSTFPLKPKLLKLKFINIFKKFRRERSRNNGIVRTKDYFHGRRKSYIWLCVLLFSIGLFMIMQLRYFLGGRLMWKYLWRAWNYSDSSGFLYQFFKGWSPVQSPISSVHADASDQPTSNLQLDLSISGFLVMVFVLFP